MNRIVATALACVMPVVLCTACGDSGKPEQTAAAGCPSQAEVEIALTNYVQKTVWTQNERYIWKIDRIDGFKVSPIQTGDLITKQVEWGAAAQEVCPVRVTYSYHLHHADGRDEVKEMGGDSTHLFYKSAFREWTFKTG